MSKRRSAIRIAEDRQRILSYFAAASTPARAPEWASAADLAALVRDGRLTKTVHREWDRQTGYASRFFGGAGVMQRYRAYYRVAR